MRSVNFDGPTVWTLGRFLGNGATCVAVDAEDLVVRICRRFGLILVRTRVQQHLHVRLATQMHRRGIGQQALVSAANAVELEEYVLPLSCQIIPHIVTDVVVDFGKRHALELQHFDHNREGLKVGGAFQVGKPHCQVEIGVLGLLVLLQISQNSIPVDVLHGVDSDQMHGESKLLGSGMGSRSSDGSKASETGDVVR